MPSGARALLQLLDQSRPALSVPVRGGDRIPARTGISPSSHFEDGKTGFVFFINDNNL